jgi:hypothetical protein
MNPAVKAVLEMCCCKIAPAPLLQNENVIVSLYVSPEGLLLPLLRVLDHYGTGGSVCLVYTHGPSGPSIAGPLHL